MMGENAMSRGAAYDQAREEFYQCRLDEEIESRVAKEEAASTGAYFGKSMVQVSTELEDRAYDTWRVWADQEFTALEQRKLGGLVGSEGAAVEGESETPTSELGESEIATLSTAISLS
jgi:small subunit ribosomal protein S23